MTNYAPGFKIPGKRGRKMPKTDALISLPMFAKYSRSRLDEIPMIKLLINMKEPENRDHIKYLRDTLQEVLEAEGLKDQFTIFNFQDILDNSKKVSKLFHDLTNLVLG